MLNNLASPRKSVNFVTSTTSTQHSRSTVTSEEDLRSNGKRSNKENSLRFKIPMSHVVSSAQNLCSEARCVKQSQLVQRSCKINEFCKDILHKDTKSFQDDTVSLLQLLFHIFIYNRLIFWILYALQYR